VWISVGEAPNVDATGLEVRQARPLNLPSKPPIIERDHSISERGYSILDHRGPTLSLWHDLIERNASKPGARGSATSTLRQISVHISMSVCTLLRSTRSTPRRSLWAGSSKHEDGQVLPFSISVYRDKFTASECCVVAEHRPPASVEIVATLIIATRLAGMRGTAFAHLVVDLVVVVPLYLLILRRIGAFALLDANSYGQESLESSPSQRLHSPPGS
jgi:hypothetical protein